MIGGSGYYASASAYSQDNLPETTSALPVVVSDVYAVQPNPANTLPVVVSDVYSVPANQANTLPVVVSDVYSVSANQANTTPGEIVVGDIYEVLKPYAETVVRLINAERAREGLAPLSVHPGLTSGASTRARECHCMPLQQYINHNRPNGKVWHTVFIEADLPTPSYGWAGENVARGYPTAAEAVSAWMASPSHRANIMTPEWVITGVGINRNSWYTVDVVQWFGSKPLSDALGERAGIINPKPCANAPER